MEIVIDFGRLNDFLYQTPGQIFWDLFSRGGWLIFIVFILIAWLDLHWRLAKKKYLNSIEHTLLAIDIPKENEQSLMAVEQIFATLAGIKVGLNAYEKYWLGKRQLYLSLEIISLEGYIQFLIRTPTVFRDLTEAAIYAQYPEAEITEVEDYIDLIPDDVYLKETPFDLWGTEFLLEKPDCYPLKTYKSFEDALAQLFIDPMASLLEVMSKLGKGEQLGLQFVIAPAGDHWKEHGYHLIKELIGAEIEESKHIGDRLVDASTKSLEKFSEAVFQMWGEIKEEKTKPAPPSLMQYLTPGERLVVEAIQNKLAQISFAVKFRLYYLGHNEVFQKGRGVNPIIGALNQFNTSNLNAFKKDKKTVTHIDYFFKKSRVARRQQKIVKRYKKREFYKKPGIYHRSKPFHLCIEELATLFHFPTITVKAPLLKKTEFKKAEPPTSLPIVVEDSKEFFKKPETLPAAATVEITETDSEKSFTVAESLPGYDFDNNYFEKRFAKDKAIKPESVAKELTEKDHTPPPNLPIA